MVRSFLWRSGADPSQAAVEAFHWTGQNDYMALTDFDVLSVGGGRVHRPLYDRPVLGLTSIPWRRDGKFGLCVDAALEKGVSARCPAFNNSVLCTYGQRSGSGREEGRFEVYGLEVFACI